MEKISTINLGGRVISIEEDASLMYMAYIQTLFYHFSNEAGWLEIMNDIENRAAELMQQAITKCNTCINKIDIDNITRVIGTADDLKKLDKDDWDICTCFSDDSNTGSDVSPAKSMYVLAENTSVQPEEFSLCSN